MKEKAGLAGSFLALAAISYVIGLTVNAGGLIAKAQDHLAKPQAIAQTIDATPGGKNAALLSLGENTIADMAEKVAPAVVNIEVDQKVNSPLVSMPSFGVPGMPQGETPFGNFEFFYNGQRVNPNGGGGAPGKAMPKIERHNTGSGFIVKPDGYIVTNAHVVRGASKIKVTLVDNRVFTGKVVGIDNFSDLAVVKIDGTDLPTVPMGTSASLRPGQFAVAIGNPLGFDHTVTLGIISAVGRSVTDVNGNINFIQTDAAINPGNSGGPLLNLQGEVIGVNTAIQANAQNIGFSIPVDIAKTVADSLIAHKPIDRPWLGIKMQSLDETMAQSLGLPTGTKGVLVAQVLDGSPAQAAGIQRGDVIQKIDGDALTTAEQVKDCVHAHKVSDTLHFFILRDNQAKAVAVNIGTFPEPAIAEGDGGDEGAPGKSKGE
jgi:S1-C subfamily serine protease